jgi:hypothetical protein
MKKKMGSVMVLFLAATLFVTSNEEEEVFSVRCSAFRKDFFRLLLSSGHHTGLPCFVPAGRYR